MTRDMSHAKEIDHDQESDLSIDQNNNRCAKELIQSRPLKSFARNIHQKKDFHDK
jgi:hypothetical protein